MAQYFGLQIPLTAVGVYQFTFGAACNGVHRKITAQQIFFEGDSGVTIYCEPGIAVPLFAFNAGQGVFIFGFGVEKNGKVLSHLLVALVE